MGMCKECTQVFSSIYMVDGYCENCILEKQNEIHFFEN